MTAGSVMNPTTAQIWMETALQQDLVAAEGEGLLDLLGELLLAEQIPLLRRQVAVEGTERALGDTHVRVVDVAVDDVGDQALRVQALADGIGQHAEFQQVGAPQQGDALRAREAFPREHLSLDRFSDGHGTSAPAPARSARGCAPACRTRAGPPPLARRTHTRCCRAGTLRSRRRGRHRIHCMTTRWPAAHPAPRPEPTATARHPTASPPPGA